jgi:N6-L-threonylcarbamoyladenine synthase/protein kinase Bud32
MSERKGKICLGIESTAHTFSVGVVDSNGKIISEATSMFRPEPGKGMIPRDAAEHHIERAIEVIKSSLERGGLKMDNIDLIAFAQGPGLPPCLRIGAAVARYLSLKLSVPIVGVNHPVGHLEIGRLTASSENPVFLYLSGGNTQIISYAEGFYRIFGETVDIPIGNALDVVARELKLKSPGGPEIERLAKNGKYVELPYGVKGMDMSFSGIVTEAKRKIKSGVSAEDISHSMQETCFAMLVEVAERALAHTGKDEILLVGGVAANKRLRVMLNTMCEERGAKLRVVEMKYASDNGVMIAWVGMLSHMSSQNIDIKRSGIVQKWRTDDVRITWI